MSDDYIRSLTLCCHHIFTKKEFSLSKNFLPKHLIELWSLWYIWYVLLWGSLCHYWLLRVNKVVSDGGGADFSPGSKMLLYSVLLARTGPNLRSKFRESIARATSYTHYTRCLEQTRGKSVRRRPFVVVLFSDNYFLRAEEGLAPVGWHEAMSDFLKNIKNWCHITGLAQIVLYIIMRSVYPRFSFKGGLKGREGERERAWKDLVI